MMYYCASHTVITILIMWWEMLLSRWIPCHTRLVPSVHTTFIQHRHHGDSPEYKAIPLCTSGGIALYSGILRWLHRGKWYVNKEKAFRLFARRFCDVESTSLTLIQRGHNIMYLVGFALKMSLCRHCLTENDFLVAYRVEHTYITSVTI